MQSPPTALLGLSETMSAASTASPAVMRSSSRRQPSYNTPPTDRPQRTASSAAKPPTTPSGPMRSIRKPMLGQRHPLNRHLLLAWLEGITRPPTWHGPHPLTGAPLETGTTLFHHPNEQNLLETRAEPLQGQVMRGTFPERPLPMALSLHKPLMQPERNPMQALLGAVDQRRGERQ